MRLAFSTLGCPGLPLPEVRDLAVRTGWAGVELLSAPDEPVHVGLTTGERRAARAALGTQISLVTLNSYVYCGTSSEGDEEVITRLLAEARLAADLGAQAVRVFPGGAGRGADARMAARLEAAAERLPDGTGLWLETHDTHRTGADVADLLDRVGHPRVRAIWDVGHSVAAGERWEDTLRALGSHLAHVQLKDERTGDASPMPLGSGDLPLSPLVQRLAHDGFAGWLSLEWERKWHPGAAPLEGVLVDARAWLAGTLAE
ncbi:sugar phosphate isomerase/epimerase family protein [Streptomyces sp. NPDC055749]